MSNMSSFDAKFGPVPVTLTIPDLRVALIQFVVLTLITYLSEVCFVMPRNARSPSWILSAMTSAVVTAVTLMIVVRSNQSLEN